MTTNINISNNRSAEQLKYVKDIYNLDNYRRSNQDTCLKHKPALTTGEWVESGDLIADNTASFNGELAIGKNILVAYMPWEGYNYEDSILINERLVYDDAYTSVHIERYEIEIRDNQQGSEQITKDIPDLHPTEVSHLDDSGLVKVGSWIEEGDILVGKVTPVNPKKQTGYQRLIFKLFDKKAPTVRDSSLRAPKGMKANVINVHILDYVLRNSSEQNSETTSTSKSKKVKSKQTTASMLKKTAGSAFKATVVTPQNEVLKETTKTRVFPLECAHNPTIQNNTKSWVKSNNLTALPALKTTSPWLNKTKSANLLTSVTYETGYALNSKLRKLKTKNGLGNLIKSAKVSKATNTSLVHNTIGSALKESYMPTNVHIYLAEKRKIQVGDKMAGRHGNKGIISNILPRQDMPYLPDGTALDIVLNPLGVPSRMNVGQIYECLLGLAGKYLGEHYKVSSFDELYGGEASRSFVFGKLIEARQKTGIDWIFNPDSPGKIRIFDGRTDECFDQPVTVGIAYMLKLVHMVDDKIHCLTPDHDVLTTNGWIPINQVTKNHQVATLTKQGELIYQNPVEVFSYPDYKGSMYRVKNANLDLFVTLNHRMLVRNGKIKGTNFESYELLEAKDIKGKHKKYLKNANWTQPFYQFYLPAVMDNSTGQLIQAKPVDMNTWLTFFGLWIAEGWVCENSVDPVTTSSVLNTIPSPLATKAVYRVQLAQVKPHVREVIVEALTNLGYRPYLQKDKITVHDKQLFNYLKPLSVGAPNKFLPDWVWSLNTDQCRTLIDSLILGDGSYSKNSARYYTTSARLKDDIMRLALHAGWSGNASIHHEAGRHGGVIDGRQINGQYDVWRIAFIKSKNNPAVNHGHQTGQNVQVEEIIHNYQGSVHCLSVPNEVFYVRRNGLPVWTGNSRSTGPYSLVTQQPLRGRAKQGGQRLGEMEVWSIEGYGAAFVLLEMLTLKSDDMTGRLKLWSDLILNQDITIGTPESFKVLVCELQALCLDIGLYTNARRSIGKASSKNKSKKSRSTDLKRVSHLMFMP